MKTIRRKRLPRKQRSMAQLRRQREVTARFQSTCETAHLRAEADLARIERIGSLIAMAAAGMGVLMGIDAFQLHAHNGLMQFAVVCVTAGLCVFVVRFHRQYNAQCQEVELCTLRARELER